MRTLRHFLCAALVSVAFVAAAFAADSSRQRYDIPAGDAAEALKQFSAASGRETLFAAEVVRGVKTPAVQGELTPQEAIDALLTDTGLVATIDEKSGAIAVRRETPAETKNALSRPADAATAEPRRGSRVLADGTVQMEQFEVTGSRIRQGSVNAAGVNPVVTYTQKEIDRLGVTTLGDFTRRITQNVPTLGSSLQGAGLTSSSPFATDARTTLNLRGLGNNTTLVLVNGRRVPKTGQGFGTDDYDLGGIPLAAVERIEVLTDGASALYGADAIGGVVNVILRQSYYGAEVNFSYGNTFDSDTAERNVTFAGGARGGRLGIFVSGSWADANALARRDRPFSASDDKRPLGGSDFRRAGAGGTGRVFRSNGQPLPGLTTSQAGIPANQNGRSLTIASFVPTDGIVSAADLGPVHNAISPYRRRNLSLDLDLKVKDWLTFFASGRYSEAETHTTADSPLIVGLTIPANNPYNPFGIAVQFDRYFYELGPSDVTERTVTPAFAAGARGNIFSGWRYELGASQARTTRSFDQGVSRSFNLTQVVAALSDVANPLVVLHDSSVAGANTAGRLESFLLPSYYGEKPRTSTLDFKADGKLFQLPAGDVAAAFGGERRVEQLEFANPTATVATTTFRDSASRSVNAAFAEVAVPVLGGDWQLPLVDQFELTAAIRTDDYSDFGRSTVPRFGALWRPKPWVLFRATKSEGFKTPTLAQLYQSVSTFNRVFTATPGVNYALDPLRNYEPVLGNVLSTQGGNPNLKPEQSSTENLGLVIELPWVKGLSLSFDRYELEFTDRVGAVNPNDIVQFFPERVRRGPPLNDGFPVGKVTEVDFRAVNFARIDTTGYDARITWRVPTSHGEFTLEGAGSKVITYHQQSAPTAAPVNLGPQRPIRAIGSLFWAHRGWEAGVTWRYIDKFMASGRLISSSAEWDLQLSREFKGDSTQRSVWSKVKRDLRVSLSVFNVLDAEPPFANTPVGFTATDPRMARYVIAVRKKL